MLGSKLKICTSYLIAIIILVCAITLAGWIFDISFLLHSIPNVIPMSPWGAFLLILCCVSFLFLKDSSTSFKTTLAKVFAIISIIAGLIKLVNEICPLHAHFEAMLLSIFNISNMNVEVGKLSSSSATNFLLAGVALLFLRKRIEVVQLLSVAILLIAWFSIIGYINRVPEFYGKIPYIPMSIRSALCFTLLGLSFIFYYPDQGIMRHFTGTNEGSRIGRLLLPTALVVPLVLGYIRLWGYWLGLFSTEFGVSLLVVSITLIFFTVLSMTMVVLNNRDVDRKKQEEELRTVNTNLKEANEEVAALNEELITSNEQLYERNRQLAELNEELQAANQVIKEQSEIIVKQKDEQLNRVLDATDNIIWSFDLTGRQENYLSRSAQRLFNRPYQELLRHRKFFFEGVVDEDKFKVQTAERLLEYYGKCETTFRVLDEQNNIRWLYYKGNIIRSEGGKPLREDGVLTDITSQRKIEEEVEIYQRNLNIIFENTKEGILLMDNEGKVVLFNLSFKKFITGITGREPEVGKYLWEVTTQERSEVAKEYFYRALAGETVQVEGTFPSPQGTITHLLRYEAIYNGDVVSNVCIVSIDITHQKENEANLRSIFESTEDIFTLLDKDLRVVTFNRGSSLFLKNRMKMEMQRGDDFLDYLPPHRVPIFKDFLKQVNEGRIVTYNLEHSVEEDREWYNVSVSPVKTDVGELIGYCITTHNITEQKLAQEKIAESEERFRALVENTEDIIGLVNSEGKLVYVSPSVTRITGYSIEEWKLVVGPKLIHEEDRLEFETFIRNVHNSKRQLFFVTFRSRHKDGHYHWMEGTAINLVDEKSINGIVINFRDITQRKNSEADKNIILQQLLYQNSELLQFSFIASHNLRGPVASMLGLFQIMDQYEITGEAKELLVMLQKTISKLDDVIIDLNKILDVRNNYVDPKELVSFSKVSREIIQSFEVQLGNNDAEVTINTESVDEFYVIKSYFYSIIYNLFSNALKYKSTERKLKIEMMTVKHRDTYGFSITDNGKGIDLERFHSKLFTLYQRFHLEVEGKGLGLFLVKTQVNAMNGTIDVKSTPDLGTTFTVMFPYKAEY